MSRILLAFFIVLLMLAGIFQAEFVLVFLYLVAGAFFVSHWWSRQALGRVEASRAFTQRAFWGEKVPVRLELRNPGILPVVWTYMRETLPQVLAVEGQSQQVVYLGPRGSESLSYTLDCRKRGYYPIGPLNLFSGDLFGMTPQHKCSFDPDWLTVFPKIVPLGKVKLPSHSPQGTLRHTQPLYPDPTRVRGKRDYVGGDSLRDVDWKATAVARRLQVKLFEPSISLDVALFLNLNRQEYGDRVYFSASELAIVVAASLANWVTQSRQAVGLVTNGIDPLNPGLGVPALPPRRGRGHLMSILDTLARLEGAETYPLVQSIQRESLRLPWGATVIAITNRVDDTLFDGLFQARRLGLNPVFVICGVADDYQATQRKARHFEIPLFYIRSEADLDIWRK